MLGQLSERKLVYYISPFGIISFVPAQPSYIYCELAATNLDDIHQLEQAGYQFSEFRIKSTLNTADSEYSTRAYYPFTAEIINEKTILTQAINLLSQNTCDDRFSNDPTIRQEFAMSGPVRRGVNTHNLKKSFRSWPTEAKRRTERTKRRGDGTN